MTTTTISAPPHQGCGVFNNLDELPDDTIHRFVVGDDTQPRALTQDEAAAELGDTFATLVLLQGVFPRTAGEVLAALERAADSAAPPPAAQFFLVGE